jgi:RHS repeat-associated protein
VIEGSRTAEEAYNLRFPGQYFDQETGKHYNYFRDYDPSLGRYAQSDPVGPSSSLNTYAYVGGHPLSALDDFGLMECSNLTCFGGLKSRRLISATRGNPSPWALENVHIEPINEPPYPPTGIAGKLPIGVNMGNELGSCMFARYRDIDEVYGIYRQFACLQVCTGDCGKAFSRWNIQEQQEDTEQRHRRERESFVKNFSAKIGALWCRQFLDGMR